MSIASMQQDQTECSNSAEKRYEGFIEWTRQNGAYFHPSLRFVVTPNRGAEVLVSGQAIQPFETLFTVPYGISLSYFNAVSAGIPGSSYLPHSKLLPEEFLENTSDHDTVNAIFLAQQYLLGERSFWYPYIQILPQPDDDKDSTIPLLWPESDLLWLRGTHLEETVAKQKIGHVKRWTDAIETLQKCGDPYWTSEDKYISLLTVRSPSLDRRGPINPSHPVRWLRHFDPTFVSMVSLRVANLSERATLRLEPQKIPSERNEQATVQFISGCLHGMLGEIDEHRRDLGEPQNERQRRADAYRLEQKTILEEILEDLHRDGP